MFTARLFVCVFDLEASAKNMNKTLIAITLIVAGLIGLLIWKSPPPRTIASDPDTGTKSTLAAPETFYDFGTISMKDGYATKDFVVSNPTDKDVFVSTLVTSCMCTAAFMVKSDGTIRGPFKMPGMGYVPPVNETINAGERFVVRVVYDPNAHGPAGVGPINRLAILTEESGATVQFEIKALVTP